MIKLRVEWHRACPSCGTELVTDFFENSAQQVTCPWCGCADGKPSSHVDVELRDYVQNAVKDIETRANTAPPVS